MQIYTTDSDIDSVLIGNDDFRVALGVPAGDGETTVRVYENTEEFEERDSLQPRDFATIVKGTFNIYESDCSPLGRHDVVATLSGHYTVYAKSHRMCFVKTREL